LVAFGIDGRLDDALQPGNFLAKEDTSDLWFAREFRAAGDFIVNFKLLNSDTLSYHGC